MTGIYRTYRTEILKLKRSFVLPLHLFSALLFGLVFAVYFKVSARSNLEIQLRYYFTALGILLPFMSILALSLVVMTEKIAGSFYNILSSPISATRFLLRKISLLLTLNFMTLAFTSVLFFVIVKGDVSVLLLAKITLYLGLSNVWVYLVGFIMSLLLGTSSVLVVGGVSTLISMLFMTSMGDELWTYMPFSWSSRGTSYLIYDFFGRTMDISFTTIITTIFIITAILFIFTLLFFKGWEGNRKNQE